MHGRRVWAETPIRLFLAALVPLIVLVPLRLTLFTDADPLTIVVLGPAFEECLKLGGVLLALTIAALVSSGGRDPEAVLPTWLFLAPWIVGGLYGMMEGVVVFPGQSGINFTVREIAHGVFVASGFAAALWVWREFGFPVAGVGLGSGVALAAHTLYNVLAVVSSVGDVTFVDQLLYVSAATVFAAFLLRREVRQEPASAETRAFLPARRRRVHP